MADDEPAVVQFQLALSGGRYEEAVHCLCESVRALHLPSSVWRPANSDEGFTPDDVERICGAQRPVDSVFELGATIWGLEGYELLAIDVFEHAAAAGSATAAAALGEALRWFGDNGRAAKWLTVALQDADVATTWLRGLLGEALYALHEEPIRAIDELRAGYHDHEEFGITLARALRGIGNLVEGRLILEHLVEGRTYGAALHLGNILQDEFGDRQGAKRAYAQGAVSGDGHSAFNLGLLHYEDGDIASAREAFDTARILGDLTTPPDLD